MTPRYSYSAINALSLNETGRFVFIPAWGIALLDSMLSQERPLYLWANDQNPLSEADIDDLDNKLSTTQGALMQSLVGLIMPICSAAAPDGTLVCDGSTHLRVDYPALYAALDAALIVDADHFITPDLRDRFILGSGTNAPTATGGSFEHVQTLSELAQHSHTTQPHTHAESAAAPTAIAIGPGIPAPSAIPAASVTGAATVFVDDAGASAPMDITPPFYALQFVVVAL